MDRYVFLPVDLHGLQNAEHLLAVELTLIQMLARGEPQAELLEAISRGLEQLCDVSACGVLLVAANRNRFEQGSHTGHPSGYIDLLEPATVDGGHTPYSLAVMGRSPIVVGDVEHDPRWQGGVWAARIRASGFASCYVAPIVSASGDAAGVVAVYKNVPRAPTVHETKIIDRFAKIAGIAMDRARADASLQARERDLRETSSQLSELERFTQAASFAFNILQDRHSWSDEFFRLFEIDPDTPQVLQTARKRVHPDDLERFDAITQYGAHGTGADLSFRIVTHDGTIKYLRGGSRLVDSIAGRQILFGTLQDITHQGLASEELRRSQESLEEVQLLAKIGSYSWVVDTDEVCVSNEFRRLLGIDHLGPVKPHQLWDRAHPDDITLVRENTVAALAGHDHDYVFRARMLDGSVKHLRNFTRGARARDGRRELVGLVVDVTASKLAEEALGQLRTQLAHVARVATLNAMTASIGHEVSQPLAGILNNANTCLRMLAGDPPNIEGAAQTARRTIRDADRALEVIRHLRRMFSAKAPIMEAVDLNDAAREVITLCSGELRRNGTILREDYAETLPRIAADRVKLQQVILNLLLNGMEAMAEAEGGTKELLVQTNLLDDGRVRLSVRDSGVGLDPRSADSLFEAFYTTKPQGMGVGLAISRSIIERHNGRLWAEANDGPGATFSFCIPGILS